jgi:hypothetical protein
MTRGGGSIPVQLSYGYTLTIRKFFWVLNETLFIFLIAFGLISIRLSIHPKEQY